MQNIIEKIWLDAPYYLQLMRLEKPIGWLLLLWPTLIALWVASDGAPNAIITWIFVAGVFISRSLGCVVNDIVDRDIDPLVTRTKTRPLSAKKLSLRQAITFAAILAVLALCLLFMLPATVWWWSVPAMVLIIVYPFMKRVMVAPQAVLGIAFSFSIPMVFVVFNRAFDAVFSCLLIANIVWVLVYDTMYAMSDREDDIQIGVKSSAIWFGDKDRLIIGILQCIYIALWFFLMHKLNLNNTFYFVLVCVAGMFIYQQILIKERLRDNCFHAFLQNGWLGGVLWFGVVLGLQ